MVPVPVTTASPYGRLASMPKAWVRWRTNSSSSTNEPGSSSCVDALARRHLALGVLLLDRRLAARGHGLVVALLEVGELAGGRGEVGAVSRFGHARSLYRRASGRRSLTDSYKSAPGRGAFPSPAELGDCPHGPSAEPRGGAAPRVPRRRPARRTTSCATRRPGARPRPGRTAAVIVTDDQTRGRGRLGRTWLAPTGKTLAISVLLRPELPGGAPFPPEGYGWIPLIAGAAMTEAVRRAVDAAASEAPARARRRRHRRRRGRAEVAERRAGVGLQGLRHPVGAAARVGRGRRRRRPQPDPRRARPAHAHSTSLLLVTGVQPDADAVLADYLGTFLGLIRTFAEHGADAAAERHRRPRERALRHPRIRGARRAPRRCASSSAWPSGSTRDGRLVVRDGNGEPQSVAAGDVTHLRY